MAATDGIRNIVLGCPAGEARGMGEFYAGLLGWRIIREDWIKVGTSLEDFPHVAFGDGWTGPGFPPQGRLDLSAPDRDVHLVLADPLCLCTFAGN